MTLSVWYTPGYLKTTQPQQPIQQKTLHATHDYR